MMFVITFAVIEFGLVLMDWNNAEKATQRATALAVTSDPAAADLLTYSAAEAAADDGSLLYPGNSLTLDKIGAFTITCTAGACACASGSCVTGTSYSSTAFNAILATVQGLLGASRVSVRNLEIDYSHVGLGFAGRPGADIVPAVTVRLKEVEHDLMIMNAFGLPASMTLPPFQSTMIGEDLNSSAP